MFNRVLSCLNFRISFLLILCMMFTMQTAAFATTVLDGEGVLGWKTSVSNGPPEYYPSANAACQRQWKSFTNSNGTFKGANATKNWSTYKCDWVGSPPFPSVVFFHCKSGYTRAVPGVCIVDPVEPRDPGPTGKECHSPTEGCSSTPTLSTADPIEILSGRVFDSARDFETNDGLLYIGRNYTSSIGEQTYLPSGVLRGAGVAWSFEAISATLKIDRNFRINKNVDFFIGDGLHFRFQLNTGSGQFVPWGFNNLDQYTRSRIEVEFVGTLPTNLSDVVTQSQDWIITDNETGRTYEITTILDGGTAKYTTGYTQTLAWRGGYEWEFTYGTSDELTSIVDSYGRKLTFTWAFGSNGNSSNAPVYITKIDLPDGTALRYDYDELGSSTAYTAALYDRMLGVEWVINPTGTGQSNIIDETEYHYEDGRYWQMLTGITDSRNERYATWTYDGVARAISSSLGNGVEDFILSYASPTSWVRTTTVTSPLGKQSIYSFNKSGDHWLLGQVDRQVSVNSPATTRTFSYANRVVSSMTDEEGHVANYARNSDARPITLTRAVGTLDQRATSFTWRNDWQISTITAPGLATAFTYNGSDLISGITQTDTTTHTSPYSTNGQTRSWAYTYTSKGRVALIDGPLAGAGDTVSYTYDANGYLATFTDTLGHTTTITSVDGLGRPLSIQDPNSIVTNLTYSNAGYLTEIKIDPSGANVVITLAYDAIGNVTSVSRSDGSSLTYLYDEARRLTSVTDSFGSSINYALDDMDGITATQVKNASNTVLYSQSQTFDELGRLLKSIGAGNETWTYAYDKVSSLTGITDPRNNSQSQAFNALNELIETVDQASNKVELTRTDRGGIASHTDPRTIVTSYVRNGWSEIIQETSPDIGTVVYLRDALGQITQKTDARGIVSQHTYDNAGRLTTTVFPAATTENVTYTYDSTASGNPGVDHLTGITDQAGVTAITYNNLGLVATEALTVLGSTGTTAYAYDNAGNLVHITYPSGRIISYWRDAFGEINSVSTKLNSSAPLVDVAIDINWQPFVGEQTGIKSLTFNNGLKLWKTFDQNYRPDEIGLYDGSTAVFQRYHGYQDKLNLTDLWDNLNSANNQAYWYAANNQLQDGNGLWGDDTFTQDGVGNLTWHTNDLGGTLTTDQQIYSSTKNQLTGIERNGTSIRTFTHDSAGNLLSDVQGGVTTTYAYNNANRMASFTKGSVTTGTYTYNARGQLVIRNVTNSSNNGITVYFYDQQGHVIAEYDGLNGNLIREYVWLGDMPLAVIDPGTTSSTTYYVHADHLNRPVVMTNAAKAFVANYVWLPYGGLHSYTGTTAVDLRFPGQIMQAESGLYYNWNRQYDPSTGRYTQTDPLGLVDGSSRYAYVGNDPLQQIDPEGLDAIIALFSSRAFQFGHLSIGINSTRTFGFYPCASCGGDGGDVFEDGPGPEILVIPTTGAQDSAMQRYITDRTLNPGNYDLLTRNCSQMVHDVLTAAGIKNLPSFFSLVPRAYFSQLGHLGYVPNSIGGGF